MDEDLERDSDGDISIQESEHSVSDHGSQDDSSDSDDDWSLDRQLNEEVSASEIDGNVGEADRREIGHGDSPLPVIRRSNGTRRNRWVRFQEFLNWALVPILILVVAIIIAFAVKMF